VPETDDGPRLVGEIGGGRIVHPLRVVTFEHVLELWWGFAGGEKPVAKPETWWSVQGG
jgi:hypothetical protein